MAERHDSVLAHMIVEVVVAAAVIAVVIVVIRLKGMRAC